MRDVTPVEALDVKLSAMMSEERFARLPLHDVDAIRSRTDARMNMDLLRQATPVAWSADTFRAVTTAAETYPCDAWPVVPPETTLRVHVCPDNVLEGISGVGPIRVLVAGFVAHKNLQNVQTLTIRGFCYVEEYRFWSPTLFLQVPIHTSSDWQAPSGHGQYSDQISSDRKRRLRSWVFAAWAFLDQRIAVEERASVDRQARKRAARLDVDPVVHVVRFRKTESRQGDDGVSHDVEWSCRWLVRGHWRNQWHPRLQRHAPAWIAPHIKGPADMPLKTPAPEVWQVAR